MGKNLLIANPIGIPPGCRGTTLQRVTHCNAPYEVSVSNPVSRVETQGNRVVAYDLIAQQERSYQAKAVVLAAGTVESAKIAQLSGLADPTNKIGVGITDHPIYFTHFALLGGDASISRGLQILSFSKITRCRPTDPLT
jgi:hypothetical protein